MSLLQDMDNLAAQWDAIYKQEKLHPSKELNAKKENVGFQLFMLQNKAGIEIMNLTSRLKYYIEQYHKNILAISNDDYDKLYFELATLEKSTGIILEDSPTRSLNLKPINAIKLIPKSTYYYNINTVEVKTYKQVNDIYKQDNGFIEMINPTGITCILQYENGYLTKAIADYDDNYYIDITNNCLAMAPIIPRRIEYTKTLIVRGKLTCLINFIAQNNILSKYKTLDEFLIYCLQLLNPGDFSSCNLSFFITDIIQGLEDISPYFFARTEFLQKLRFLVTPVTKISQCNDYFITYIKTLGHKINLPFTQIYFKTDICDKSYENNITIYYNCYQSYYSRILKDITWRPNYGKRNTLIPLGIIDPIYEDDLKIRQISLPHQIDILTDMIQADLLKSDSDEKWIMDIYKINGITSQFNQIVNRPSLKQNNIIDLLPKKCPYCNAKVQIIFKDDPNIDFSAYTSRDILFLQCLNPLCQGKFINKIKHFVGEHGLNIKGFSSELVEWLIDEKKWVNNLMDIYTLQKYEKEWILEDNFNKENINFLLEQIENSKNCSFTQFLKAVNIPLVTEDMIERIVAHFKNYDNFSAAICLTTNYEYFKSIFNFTDEQIRAIINFDYTEFDKLWKVFKYKDKIPYTTNYFPMPLRKKTYVVVGPVKYFDSVEWLCGYIHGEGGAAVSQVTENVDYVINNDPDSECDENIAARELGIPIITEEEFLSNIY